ncbi:MAG: hypothetical protein VX798_00490, partial [Bacteroidota bacterium]|nr:hypothetical protein [Bacteroidota bacterium]
EVLADGNDGGGLAITNIADPTAAQDAATKAYVDSVSDDDITGASLDAPSNVLTISEGTTDVTVDLSDLDDSAGVAANASDIATNTTNISTNASNIANNTTDIATNTADITTNTSDIATNTTDISTNATDIANHVAADGDLSSTNEIQNLGEVLADGNDGGGLAITNIADPTAAQDAATKAYVDSVSDDDITGASLDAPSNVLTISEGATDVTVDLSDLDDSAGIAANASDIATNTTNISTNASDIANNTTDIATNTADIATNTTDIAANTTNISTNATDIANHIAADADTNIGNEYNTGSGIAGGNLEITDGGGTESVNLISGDANNNITAGSDGALYLNVASVSIAETNTTLSFDNTTSELTYTNELGNNPVVDISSLDDSAGVAANASNIATNTTNISTNTADIATNTADIATNTSDITTNTSDIAANAADIGTNTTNIAANTSDIATNTTDIANHVAADGDLSSTNEIQNLGEVLADGNDGGGLAITNIADPTAAQDAATKAYVDSVSDDDITGASLDAPSNVLTISEGTTDVTVDLSDLDDSAGVAANASDIATNASDIGTNSTNIATNTSDIATNATNISTNTADIATNTTDIAANTADITTNTSDIATNASDIGTNATNIATNTSDIATNTADIATNATNISTNATDISNHIAADGDLSSTNEIQNLGEVLADGNDGGGLAITNIADPSAAQDAATKAYVDGVSDDDITGASLDAPSNVLTISEGTTDVTVDLSDLDDSAGVAANASDIATNASDIGTNSTNIATNTSDIATNTADIATNTSDIATNASDIATNATNISTNATDISNHIAADGDLSSTNEIQNLDEVLADGNDGGGLAITNIADPTAAQDAATKAYVDSVSDDDITGASLDAPSNVLTISEGTTDVTVDLSDLDDSAGVAANASDIATNASDITTNAGNIATNATDIGTNATNIATNTSDIANNTANIATNTADIATNTTDISTNASDIATNTTNISTNATDIANHVAADGDLSSTNEIQNLGEVLADGNDGGGLAITNIADPTAAQDAATKAYVDGVADDDITGASLDAPTNVLTISEGATDVTVDLSDLDDSAGVAANASDIATNTTNISTNASDIANNTTDIATNTTNIGTNATNIATNTTDIAANTADIATNTSDIATNTTDIATNTTNISTNATDIANHVAADGDLSSTNEIQNLGEVLADGNDGGGLAITNIADPTAAQDAATKAYVDGVSDDDITGASLDAPTNVLTISEGTTDVTVDLSDLDDSAGVAANASNIATNATDIGTNATNIATNTSDIATNTSDIATNASDIATNTTNISTNATDIANHVAADGDLSSTNEIQNIEEVLTDGNDANGLVLTGLGAPTAASDAATKAYVDSVSDDDITGASLDAPTNVLTISEGTTDVTVDLSDLDDSAGVAANASDIATNTTNISTNASDIASNTADIATNTADIATNTTDISTNASDIATNTTNISTNATDIANHVAADGDLSSTNEINTRFEVNGTNLEIEDSNGTLQVPLADINTDDQLASEVNSDSPIDVDGDGNTEATVEDVIQDIAPITSKAARIFYPPSIAIDASSNGTGRTVDLYAQYVAQYGTPAVSSAGAPAAVPTYSATELYYYVTYADPTVFDNMSIDANGVLTYDIIGQPADYNALINVVFVVK